MTESYRAGKYSARRDNVRSRGDQSMARSSRERLDPSRVEFPNPRPTSSIMKPRFGREENNSQESEAAGREDHSGEIGSRRRDLNPRSPVSDTGGHSRLAHTSGRRQRTKDRGQKTEDRNQNTVPAVGIEPTPPRFQRGARPSSCTEFMPAEGIEPTRYGLKVRCSAI